MRRSFLAAALAVPLSLMLGGAASAQGRQDFALVNRTGYQINEVYVGVSNGKTWGNDLLGADVMPDGNQLNVTFSPGTSACQWDIRVVYDDGDEAEFHGVNLCRISTVTLFWNRQAGTTRAVVE